MSNDVIFSHLFGIMAGDERINVWHFAIYMSLFQKWLVNGRVNPVSISRSEIMRQTHIRSIVTYHKYYMAQADEGSSFEEWKPDGLLWYIINAKTTTGKIPEDVIYKNLYSEIFSLTKLPKDQAEKAMKTYLENWYRLHKDDPWYDAHEKERTYRGYWCWEAGAITKIMGLDDSSYKDNPYYPYDLVHWKG